MIDAPNNARPELLANLKIEGNTFSLPEESVLDEHVASCRFCRFMRRLGLLWIVVGRDA